MKRFVICFALLFGIILFTSCKKDTPISGEIIVPKTTIAPTFTPTPFPEIVPLEEDVTAVAYATYPLLSGQSEPVWSYVNRTRIEKVSYGSGDCGAFFSYFWNTDKLYVRVIVNDSTNSVGNKPKDGDNVSLFLNESNVKPKKYGNGDLYLIAGRDGTITYGPGCNQEEIKTVCYEKDSGYVVEFCIPFVTIRGSLDVSFGFDLRVEDFANGSLVQTLCYQDISNKTESTLEGVGEIVCDAKHKIIDLMPGDSRSELWDMAPYVKLNNTAYGTEGATAKFRLLYDDKYLYILVNVYDKTEDTDSVLMTRKDGVEIFINWDNLKPLVYRSGYDMHYRISRDANISYESGADEEAFQCVVHSDDSGYSVSAAIRLNDVVFSDNALGLDVHVNDSFGSQMRDYIVVWSDISLLTYSNLSKVGTVKLK